MNVHYTTLDKEEAWRRSCDAGSHTHGREFEPHWGIYLQIFLISAPSCHVPCPDGVKLQSLGIVRFRNWHSKLVMTIATNSSKLAEQS